MREGGRLHGIGRVTNVSVLYRDPISHAIPGVTLICLPMKTLVYFLPNQLVCYSCVYIYIGKLLRFLGKTSLYASMNVIHR